MVRWSSVEARPLVIAGPCSAESEEQLHETARRLSGVRVDYLRAGIWKARTRPNSFEGIGTPALQWLKSAGREFGLRTATEVARAEHVEAALRADIDLLWVGARTTTNPFSVQEVAIALRGCDVPILVKNPTSRDLGLWIGAIERIAAVGVEALAAVHRGVTEAWSAPYRNAPAWDMAIEFRRRLPQVPLLCDPSHICGRRDLIRGVAQHALDLGYDGLMIEAHRDPDRAWSDADQQVTPERLGEILSELIRRAPEPTTETSVRMLEDLRRQIDGVDRSLVALLAERAGIVDLIGSLKRKENVMPLQPVRWRRLLRDRMAQAIELGLDPGYVKTLYELIHGDSVRRQSDIVSGVTERPEATGRIAAGNDPHGGDRNG